MRWAGGPAGEQAQCVVRRGIGLGGVGEQALTRIGRDREGLEREIKISDDRVVDELDAGGVDPDVVRGPSAPELAAAGGQLPDQVRKSPVAGIAAGLCAQQGDSVAGDLVPVAEELGLSSGSATSPCWLVLWTVPPRKTQGATHQPERSSPT